MLLRTEWQKPFLIGDSPLALQNSYDMGPYGNLGLTVPGIEIYFLYLLPERWGCGVIA